MSESETSPLSPSSGEAAASLPEWETLGSSWRFMFSVAVYSIGSFLHSVLFSPYIEYLFEGDSRTGSVVSGWLSGVSCLFQFLFLPLLGVLADRFGRKKLLLLAMFGAFIENVCAVVTVSRSLIFFLFAGKIISGATGCFQSVSQSFISDLCSKERRTAFFTVFNILAMTVPLIVGPLTGAYVLSAGWPYSLVFSICALIILFSLLWVLFLVRESLKKSTRAPINWKKANPVGTMMHFRRSPFLSRMAFVYMVLGFVFAGFSVLLFFYVRERYHVSTTVILLVVAGAAVLNIITTTFAAKMSRRYGERKIVFVALSFGSLSLIVMGIAPVFWVFLIGQALVAWVPACLPPFMSILSKNIAKPILAEILSGVHGFMLLAAVAGVIFFPTLFFICTSDGVKPSHPGIPLFLGGCLLILLAVFVHFLFKKFPHDEIRVTQLGEEKKEEVNPENSIAAKDSNRSIQTQSASP